MTITSHVSVDIGRVTITVLRECKGRLIELLGDLATEESFYDGWIDDKNPSPSPIGFALFFVEDKVYADFHNLPYYYRYRSVNRWDEYHARIVSYVARNPSFAAWEGNAPRFNPADLTILVRLLDELCHSEDFPRVRSTKSRFSPSELPAPPVPPIVPEPGGIPPLS